MTASNSSRRRAAALLITLAAVILVTGSLTALAAAATGAESARRATARSAMAEDLLLSSDALVADWLRRDSARAALPLASAEPRIEIAHSELTMAGQSVTLIITAWDQQGMVPIEVGRSGSLLRLTLPSEAQTAIDEFVGTRATQPYGLDQIAATAQGPVFPEPTLRRARTPAIGALVATHAGGSGRATVNVNTAPLPLLEAALREAGAGGLDAILAARAEGKPARIGAIGLDRSDRDHASRATLTDASSAWAIRTDITIGPRRCSWWSIWQRRSGAWRLVQRMEIAE